MPFPEAGQRVAAEFEYSDDAVCKSVTHFINQMRMPLTLHPQMRS